MTAAEGLRCRVAVTGGAGFLGSHLVPGLVRAGHDVTVIDAVAPPPWARETGVRYLRADVRDEVAVRAAFTDVQVVLHAAFASPHLPPRDVASVNVKGTELVCRAAVDSGAAGVVLVSSTIVERQIGLHPLLPRAPINRLRAYGASRAEAESVARQTCGARTWLAAIRPKTFIGPGRVGGFYLVFDLIRKGATVPLLGPGENRYQLLDVRDLADCLLRLVVLGGEGVYHLGATRFGTVRADLKELITRAGSHAEVRALPRTAGQVLVRAVELAGMHPLAEWHHCTARGEDSVVDISRARTELGWEPARGNAEALADAYTWYATRRDTSSAVRTTHPVPATHRALGRLAAVVPGRR